MNKQLANDFLHQATKSLGFLVRDYGFAAPELEIDEAIDFAYITFLGKNLAIELILDAREEDIDCKISLVRNGVKTDHFSMYEQGLRGREGLNQLVRRKGVTGRLFKPLGALELRERIEPTLADFARILRDHGRDILCDSPLALK